MFEKSRTLWDLMHGQRLRYFGAFGAMLVSIPLSYVAPLIGGVVIDHVVRHEALRGPAWLGWAVAWLGGRSVLVRNLWIGLVGVVFFTAAGGLFGYFRAAVVRQASEAIARRLRDRLYDHLQRLPCSYHDRAATGDLVQRCTSDVETIRGFLSNQVVEITRAIVMVAWVLPFMLALSRPMTALAMAMLPLIALFALAVLLQGQDHLQGPRRGRGQDDHRAPGEPLGHPRGAGVRPAGLRVRQVRRPPTPASATRG